MMGVLRAWRHATAVMTLLRRQGGCGLPGGLGGAAFFAIGDAIGFLLWPRACSRAGDWLEEAEGRERLCPCRVSLAVALLLSERRRALRWAANYTALVLLPVAPPPALT